jgi:hypothetical protein
MTIIMIAGIVGLLLFCLGLVILAVQIRRQVNRIDMRLEKLILALNIQEAGETEKIAKPARRRKGLQLDDADIEKLRKIGVGMD